MFVKKTFENGERKQYNTVKKSEKTLIQKGKESEKE